MQKIKLYSLPFAGGSKYSYQFMAKGLAPEIELKTVEIPGRGTRANQTPYTDLHLVVDDIFNQIKGELHEPYAIYGHSMGTMLGYLLTKRIIRERYPLPLMLFFTGAPGPSRRNMEKTKTYDLPQKEFFLKLKELGGSPDEILNNKDLMEFFEPILRADFQAVETYRYQETTPFHIPMQVIIGKDEKTTVDEAMAWQKETTDKFDLLEFPGQHFFIFEHSNKLIEILNKQLTDKLKVYGQ